MAPPASQSQSEHSNRMYSARAHKYDDSHHPDFAAHMLSLSPPARGSIVLDLATGTGAVAIPAARAAGPEGLVIGLDVADGMLDVARGKVLALRDDAAAAAPVELYSHSISELESCAGVEGVKGRVDLLVCCSALVLLDDPRAALRSWVEHVRVGGLVNVDVIHPRCGIAGVVMERAVRRVGISCPYNRAWVTSLAAVVEVFEEAGVFVERVEYVEQLGWPEGRVRWVKGAEEQWEGQVGKEAWAYLGEGEKAELKKVFMEEWAKEEGEKGVEEWDGVWVVVGRKTG